MNKVMFDGRMTAIMAQQKKLGVKIEITDLIDKDHLDCTWYGGEIGRIVMADGWTILIEAHGEIRLHGEVKEHGYIDIVDKNNGGRVFTEIGYWCDDDELYRLLESCDEQDSLEFGNNNWFECNVLSPTGQFFDMCWADNILDDNVLECFEHAETLFGYVDAAKEQAKTA